MDIISIIIAFAIVLMSLTVHETAHAWTADQLGDPTARLLGRISLNPIVHIDLLGTVILPILAAFSNLPIIGWAKPVPVNISRLRHPRRDFVLVAAAGPASNIVLAILASVLLHTYRAAATGAYPDPLIRVLVINVLLAVFNMVPVPPLDGGNVLAGLLPPQAAAVFVMMRQWGFIILYALMLTGVLNALIMPPATFLIGLLLP